MKSFKYILIAFVALLSFADRYDDLALEPKEFLSKMPFKAEEITFNAESFENLRFLENTQKQLDFSGRLGDGNELYLNGVKIPVAKTRQFKFSLNFLDENEKHELKLKKVGVSETSLFFHVKLAKEFPAPIRAILKLEDSKTVSKNSVFTGKFQSSEWIQFTSIEPVEKMDPEFLAKQERERLEKERLEKERLEREKQEQERLAQEKLEKERLEQERLEREKQEQERLALEKLEKERLEKERLERERQEKERLAQEKLEKERLEKERVEKERQEKARIVMEKLEKERVEKERLEKERQEKANLLLEQLEKERQEKAKLAQQKLERERQEKERLAQEKLENDRLEKERLEKERQEKAKLAQEKLERERQEQERLAQEKLERERQEQERLAQEKLEKERVEKDRQEKAKLAQEKLEKDRLARKEEEAQRTPAAETPRTGEMEEAVSFHEPKGFNFEQGISLFSLSQTGNPKLSSMNLQVGASYQGGLSENLTLSAEAHTFLLPISITGATEGPRLFRASGDLGWKVKNDSGAVFTPRLGFGFQTLMTQLELGYRNLGGPTLGATYESPVGKYLVLHTGLSLNIFSSDTQAIAFSNNQLGFRLFLEWRKSSSFFSSYYTGVDYQTLSVTLTENQVSSSTTSFFFGLRF